MSESKFKNIDFSNVLNMENLVTYQTGQVVSRTLAQNKLLSITLFAFDKNEEIATHSSGGDAMMYILDGACQVQIGDENFSLKKGDTIVMPAGIPHSLSATNQFKMLLIVVF